MDKIFSLLQLFGGFGFWGNGNKTDFFPFQILLILVVMFNYRCTFISNFDISNDDQYY